MNKWKEIQLQVSQLHMLHIVHSTIGPQTPVCGPVVGLGPLGTGPHKDRPARLVYLSQPIRDTNR